VFTDEDLRLMREWTLAALNTMHPHGDGCWHVHWPCRVLPLIDMVTALNGTLVQERVARARALEEDKALITVLSQQLDQVRFVLARQRSLIAQHHESVKQMDEELGALHA
jgi:hypothetical protein